MVLYRIGPSLWLTGQIFAWGFVATFQSFQHGVGPYMATRFLLGTCESGFIPAGFYTITRWYKRDESSKRFSIFFLGNMCVQALGGDIAYGVLHMRGVAGLAGWQWLFILEGLITIAVGVVFGVLFPRSPAHPISLTNIRWFTEKESQILVQRVVADDPTKHQNAKNVTKEELKRTLTNWRLIPHILLTLCGLSPCTTLLSYGPSLVAAWGYGQLRSNAIVSIGPWCMVVLNVLVGFWADKISLRGPLVLLGGFFWWLFLLINRLEVFNPNVHTRLGVSSSYSLPVEDPTTSYDDVLKHVWISANSNTAPYYRLHVLPNLAPAQRLLDGVKRPQCRREVDHDGYPHHVSKCGWYYRQPVFPGQRCSVVPYWLDGNRFSSICGLRCDDLGKLAILVPQSTFGNEGFWSALSAVGAQRVERVQWSPQCLQVESARKGAGHVSSV